MDFKNKKAIISHYKSYMNNPTPHMRSNVEGQIYELYCYSEILQNNKNIKIVKSNSVKKQSFGNFSYSRTGKINYHSSKIHLAEFDILGFKGNELYWWEVTKSKNNKKAFKIEVSRKKELLQSIFKNRKLIFQLVLPFSIHAYKEYPLLIIEEPKYEEYFKQFFILNNKFHNCISLSKLAKLGDKYDYIGDIIKFSHMFFVEKKIDLSNLKTTGLIERLYDIENINKNKFAYYDVIREKMGLIMIEGKKVYKDNTILKSTKKAKQEIIRILERISYKKY